MLGMILAFTGCSHIFPFIRHNEIHPPPSFGAFGRQCQQVREVYCFVDEDLSKSFCELNVVTSINIVNKALGRQILHYAGTVEVKSLAETLYKQGHILIFGDTLPEGILGLTSPSKEGFRPEEDCIGNTLIGLSNQVTLEHGVYSPVALQVTLHEFLHAVGAQHSSSTGVYGSIMTPGISDPAWVDHISAYDISALRAIYGE